MVKHSKEKLCGISPINDPQMGLKITDSGLVYATAENSKQRQEYRTEFSFKIGLNIKDIRACARVRNIDARVSEVSSEIIQFIYQARNEVFRGSEPVMMYVPKRMLTHFQIMAEAKQNVVYDRNNPYDVPMYRFGDMMIRPEDALSITEAAVAAV
jgi:metal-sulfur cluster biosynthetic enzyme